VYLVMVSLFDTELTLFVVAHTMHAFVLPFLSTRSKHSQGTSTTADLVRYAIPVIAESKFPSEEPHTYMYA
jgi:hypothetical protein